MVQVTNIGEITEAFLAKAIEAFVKTQLPNYAANIEYAEGRNPTILNRITPDDSGPDNKIPVSYARRIINLVVGYMFKPGLIAYAFGDDRLSTSMQEVFDYNREPLKSSQMGKQTSIHGVGYEYHYVDGDGTRAIPRFVKLPATEVIPIYDRALEPELIAFVRFYPVGDDKYQGIFVTDKEIYEFEKERQKESLRLTEPMPHFYGRVPLVVFKNNEETIGDFDPVEPLIDAYDVLVSDSLNEFDRFSWAYLLLKGMSMSDDNAENIKRMRIFEQLESTEDVKFLTKDIDTEFIRFMTDLVRSEIHRQSGIPNIEDYDGAGASGKTLTKFIYMMELFTDPKESYFKEGLIDRLELINTILTIQGKGGDVDNIDVIMNRNAPDNSLEQAGIFNAYSGGLTLKTRIENFADVVDNADEEIEQLKAEQQMDVERFMGAVNADESGTADEDNR